MTKQENTMTDKPKTRRPISAARLYKAIIEEAISLGFNTSNDGVKFTIPLEDLLEALKDEIVKEATQ